MKPTQTSLPRRILHSVFPGFGHVPINRDSDRFLLRNLLLHFRPTNVPEPTLRFTLTWGLGGMAVVLIVLQVVTGMLLKFVYEPSPDGAHESIVALQTDVWFGQLIRNIHSWGGDFLVIVVFLHFLRVFFTGAFQKPRRLNWIVGVCLFLFAVASNLTGYLLPWDQTAYWAITICTGMLEYIPGIGLWLQKMIRGGPTVGPTALKSFFVFHTAVIPVCLLLLLPFHFWRIRKAGGLVILRAPGSNPGGEVRYVPTVPNLLLREVVVALVLIAFLLVVSIVFNAPLEEKANPGMSPNPTKAPWYFLGIQEILLHFHPLFAVFIIPILVITALFLMPFLHGPSDETGIWFRSQKGRHMVIVAAVAAAIIAPLLIVVDDLFLSPGNPARGLPLGISRGLIPGAVLVAALCGFCVALKRKYAASRSELIQAMFVLLLTTFVVLTITGIWFRGKGMELVWPWG